jgi:hypothetical protein
VLASVETAVSTTIRPGILGFCWHWRYELILAAGLPGTAIAIGFTLGIAWLVAVTVTGCILLTAAMTWRPSRRRLVARAWCVITPHRVRAGCRQAWVQSRDGRLPVVLYTSPADFGERVLIWCRAGITAADLQAAHDIIRTACWASDVHVIESEQRRHIVVLEVVRRNPTERPTGALPSWPYLPQGEAETLDPEEPATSPWQMPV